jgi:hypothetical protein
MRAARIGSALLALGLLVGIGASLGLLMGFEPARLPRALLNIAAYKLTFVAAVGLFAAGATVLRYARREEARAPAPFAPKNPAMALVEGQSPAPAPAAPRHPEGHPEATRTARSTEQGVR